MLYSGCRCIFLTLFFMMIVSLFFEVSTAQADIVLLKNGQVIENVKVWKGEGEIRLESSKQTFYFNPEDVKTIIRTGENNSRISPSWWEKYMKKRLPPKLYKTISDHQQNILFGLWVLIGIAGLGAFVVSWKKIKKGCKNIINRKTTIASGNPMISRNFSKPLLTLTGRCSIR